MAEPQRKAAPGDALNRTQVERRGLLLEPRGRFRRHAAGMLHELGIEYKPASWCRDDLREALNLIPDVRAATLHTVAAASGRTGTGAAAR